jgi:hypothetical protein
MSYICLVSNGVTAAIAGDTRKNYIAMHSDNAQKVFARQDGGAIWGCCGLMHLGFCDCVSFAQMILEQHDRPIEKKLEHIALYVRPLLEKYRLMTFHRQGFSVLYGEKCAEGIVCFRLDVNTTGHSIHRYCGNVFLESGSGTKHFSGISGHETSYADPAVLVSSRVLEAIRLDGERSSISNRRTVGGHVRVKILV